MSTRLWNVDLWRFFPIFYAGVELEAELQWRIRCRACGVSSDMIMRTCVLWSEHIIFSILNFIRVLWSEHRNEWAHNIGACGARSHLARRLQRRRRKGEGAKSIEKKCR